MRLALPVRRSSMVAAGPVSGAALILVAAVIALVPASPGGTDTVPQLAAQPTHPSLFFDERAFSAALAQVEASAPEPMPGARAVIIPHHWLAGHLILGGIRDLAASGDYHRIILIGPNHTNAGNAPIITSDRPWQTPFGRVQPDRKALRALHVPQSEPYVLTYEHSVAGIIPAVARYLPKAQVVPLILWNDLPPAEVRQLAEELASLMDDHTAIVAAVDFSHYLPTQEARRRDRETLTALEGMDSERVLSYGDEHLDSPATIAAVTDVMRLVGATDFKLRQNGDSSELGGSAMEVTSYIYGYYR